MLQSLLCFLLAFQSGEAEVDFLVIEIGGKGPKALVISHDFRVIDTKSENASPLKGMAHGLMTELAMQDCLNATTSLISEMKENLRKKDRKFEMMLVASSSVSSAKNFASFKSTMENHLNVKIESVTADEEAGFIFSTIVPQRMRHDAMALDIGSGNARVAWLDEGLLKQITIPIGTVVATNMGSTTKDLALEIQGLLPPSPNVKGKQLHLYGGIAWALKSFDQNEKSIMNLEKIKALDLKANLNPDVAKVFNYENLYAGRILLLELLKWTGSDLCAVEFVNQPGSWVVEWLKKRKIPKRLEK